MCDLTNPIFTDETKARVWLEAERWPDLPEDAVATQTFVPPKSN